MMQKQEKKYIILENETLEYDWRSLYRIKAVKNFSDVKKGDKGGWIEKEENLSQEGECWVYHEAKVFGKAVILDNAKVYNEAQIYNEAKVFDNAHVSEYVKVRGSAKISGQAHISGSARVTDNAYVYAEAHIRGDVVIKGDAVIKKDSDYEVFKNNWSSGRYFTYTKSNKMWCVGCFYGTGEELIKKAYKDSELSGKMYEKYVNFVKEQEEIEEEVPKS